MLSKEGVAPLVGAWIEIIIVQFIKTGFNVAPLVGAWIEISQNNRRLGKRTSLLSWERGLKFRILFISEKTLKSLLSWERGLKFDEEIWRGEQ